MPETLPQKTLSGRYVIERELRRAGVATAYLAHDLKSGRRVTLKVLRVDLGEALGADRLADAIGAGAGLKHPNILPLIGAGVSDGLAYYVTPHVEGETLRERLDRERQLPIDDALRIAGGVAAALDFAHRHGIVHLDVKPEKILLSGGEPLVVDFGLALGLADAARERSAEARVFGTPAYMSPEQATGNRAVDGRSDQYSLACVLYEMLAGEPPFSAPSVQGVIEKVLAEPPPRLTVVRVVPRVIERAIDRALSKAPADRFRTAAELMAALRGASTPSPVPAESPTAAPTAARQLRWRVAAIGSAVMLLVVAGVVTGSRIIAERRAPSPAAHRQLTFAGTATSPDLSPDGRSVAYVAGGRALLLQRLDGGAPLQLVSARLISAARWTGDGRALVATMTRDSTEAPATYLVPAAGGSPRKVVDEARPFDTGTDSTLIVRAPRERGRLEIVSLVSGKPVRTIELPDSIGVITEVAWSPDRRWLAFTDENDGLWVVAGGGGGSPSRVTGGARRIRWAAGSDAIYFLNGPAGAVDLLRLTVDPQSGRAVGAPAHLTSLLAADAFDVGLDRLVHTQTSSNGRARTFVIGGAAPRRVIEEQSLGEAGADVSEPAISPDGRWIAYTATRGAERDIHVVAFRGGSARVVASSRAREESPTWSPDGTRLTFAREDSAGRRLVMADARSGAAQRIGSLPGPGVSADAGGPRSGAAAARWSASGRHVAYYAQDRRRIGLVNVQRRNESVVRMPDSVGAGYYAVLPSPNGTQLLASTITPRDERAALWLVLGNGRRWRRIRGPYGETFPVAWHRNGWIYFVRDRALATDHGAVHVELWRMRGPNGRPELYAPLPEGCGVAVSLSTDATRGVCNYARVESDIYVAATFGTAAR